MDYYSTTDDYSNAFINQRLLKHQLEQQEEARKNASMLSIYAEINHQLLRTIENSNRNILSSLPAGVSLIRKKGKRACFFECDDADAREQLIDFLDNHNIPWQDN